MKKIFLYALFCLVSSACMALESDSTVVFKAAFLKNEMQAYDVSRVLYTIRKNDTTSLERLRFRAEVFVKDSTATNYLINWKFLNFSIDTKDLSLKQLIALAQPVEIGCRLSKPGVLMDFLNGQDVSKCLETALPEVLSSFADQKGKDTLAKVKVAAIYDLRETLETLMLRTITQFHQAYGLGYTLGEVVDVPTELNSRFTTKSIPGMVRKKLTKLDSVNNLAGLSTATFYDKYAFQKAFVEYMKLDPALKSSVNQANMGGLLMDLMTGWVLWSFEQNETRVLHSVYGEMVEITHLDQ